MEYVKFEDNPHLIRDPNSKAVLITDSGALAEHLKQREQFVKVNSMELRINKLEDKLDMIIKLLSEKD